MISGRTFVSRLGAAAFFLAALTALPGAVRALTATSSPAPTATCTPGHDPPPGCRYEGPTFTNNPSTSTTPTRTPEPRTQCVGDCNGNGMVTVDELLTGVNIALGTVPSSNCPAFDCSSDCGPGPGLGDPATVTCLIRAVNNALEGCPPFPCVQDEDCDDANPCSRDQCTPSGCTHSCLCV